MVCLCTTAFQDRGFIDKIMNDFRLSVNSLMRKKQTLFLPFFLDELSEVDKFYDGTSVIANKIKNKYVCM